jgi:transposase-like protein
MEAVEYFADANRALAFAVQLRWPSGVVVCPACGRNDASFLANQRKWQCKSQHAQRQFSIKTGTIFEDSPLGLDKWLLAMWMLGGDRNGTSSCEIARKLGITQKSAWFMMHRIRLAMKNQTLELLKGDIEIDETYIGGKARSTDINPHTGKLMPTGPKANKTIVMGMIERNGRVRASSVPNVQKKTLKPIIEKNVTPGATVYTDALATYNDLGKQFDHYIINHAVEYVHGHIHTNGIENFWSVLKRTINGTYTFTSVEHLDRYLDEQIFRHDNRKEKDVMRFKTAVKGISGKRLTYKLLIANMSEKQKQQKEKLRVATTRRLAAKRLASALKG